MVRKKSYRIRKTFLTFVFCFVMAQFFSVLVFFALNSVFDWLILSLIIVPLNILLSLLLFFNWYMEYYVISEDGISHTRGVLFRRTETYDIQSFRSVKIRQGLLGLILRYGDVLLDSPLLRKRVYMTRIHNPYKYAKIIDVQRLKMLEDKPLKDITPVV